MHPKHSYTIVQAVQENLELIRMFSWQQHRPHIQSKTVSCLSKYQYYHCRMRIRTVHNHLDNNVQNLSNPDGHHLWHIDRNRIVIGIQPNSDLENVWEYLIRFFSKTPKYFISSISLRYPSFKPHRLFKWTDLFPRNSTSSWLIHNFLVLYLSHPFMLLAKLVTTSHQTLLHSCPFHPILQRSNPPHISILQSSTGENSTTSSGST